MEFHSPSEGLLRGVEDLKGERKLLFLCISVEKDKHTSKGIKYEHTSLVE